MLSRGEISVGGHAEGRDLHVGEAVAHDRRLARCGRPGHTHACERERRHVGRTEHERGRRLVELLRHDDLRERSLAPDFLGSHLHRVTQSELERSPARCVSQSRAPSTRPARPGTRRRSWPDAPAGATSRSAHANTSAAQRFRPTWVAARAVRRVVMVGVVSPFGQALQIAFQLPTRSSKYPRRCAAQHRVAAPRGTNGDR